MRSKRFNNVAMLKKNIAVIKNAPYIAAYARRVIEKHKVDQLEEQWASAQVDAFDDDDMEVIFIPENTH